MSENAFQQEMRTCPYCRALFHPRRKQQEFCSDPCRVGYHKDVGTEGTVAAVTRIRRGVSVCIHFDNGPAAERAIKLMKGARVRAVEK